MDTGRKQCIREWALIVLFIGFLALPLLLFVSQSQQNGISEQEKRVVAAAPKFTLPRFFSDAYQKEYEQYFNDHFGLRNKLVTANGALHYYALATSPNDKVLIGNDHWLFYSAEQTIERYKSGNVLSAQELASIAQLLQDEQRLLIERGIQFIILVAPDKETIYPEQMPRRIKPSANPSTLDSFLNAMKDTNVTVIDPRSALQAQARLQKLYTETDTHWTDRGAQIAFDLVRASLSQDITDTIEYRETEFDKGDLANLISLGGRLHESIPEAVSMQDAYNLDVTTRNGVDIRTTTTSDADERTILVFRDSFGEKLIPFFASSFNHATFEREYFDGTVIDELQPDVVVLQIVERNIVRLTEGREAHP